MAQLPPKYSALKDWGNISASRPPACPSGAPEEEMWALAF